ncbi:SigE family RNA polymerase sigma factor [Lentzea flava]|uniref:RNA polymerase sigma24 factor n=1 Tax=Lentzea flava TaxID=103732 RepID=A0ABQ2UEL4_9PSEU|nr:SigE family RNA polymerase sigma factor [Lentzea flava]MCP2198577.1 RNA polymerase sigma-70 factor, sigma-E family [Lentzea flava]GGU26836.1 RNA polymerase sigma24 factor [Lentzea flava]
MPSDVNRDPELVVYLIVQREKSADFDRFVLDRSTALLRTAVLLVGDVGHAEDILQTALLRLATRWKSVHTAPEAFVRTVLVNLARDRWRRARRRVSEEELTNAGHVTDGRDPADTVVDRDALRRALATLPARQREVVVLRFFADLSVAETAQTLRTSEGTVKAHTSRAVARLRQLLGEQITENVHGV